MKCPSLWHAWSRRKMWRRLDLDGSGGQRLNVRLKTVNAGKSWLDKWRLWRGGLKIKGWEIESGKSRGGNRVRTGRERVLVGGGVRGWEKPGGGGGGGGGSLVAERFAVWGQYNPGPCCLPGIKSFHWPNFAQLDSQQFVLSDGVQPKQFWMFSMSWCFPMCPLWNWQTQ